MNVEQAVQKAIDYVRTLFQGIMDLRLEEVEAKDDESWEITVSFRGSGQNIAMFGKGGMIDVVGQKAAIGVDPSRFYKEVKIDKDGTVKWVRMRQIVVG